MAKVISTKDGQYLFDITRANLPLSTAEKIAAAETEHNTCEWPEPYEAWAVGTGND